MKSFKSSILKIQKYFIHNGLTLATAESCTGGWLAKLFTNYSNASQFYKGGVVVYQNKTKNKVLGIKISENQSAVNKKTAVSMAQASNKLFLSDLSIATTGYMEPCTELKLMNKKATGVCFFALSFSKETKLICKKKFFYGSRHQNRVSASREAVTMLIEAIGSKNYKETKKE